MDGTDDWPYEEAAEPKDWCQCG